MNASFEAVGAEIVPVDNIITAKQACSLGNTVRALFEERQSLTSFSHQHGQINWFQGDLEKSRLAPSATGGDREIELSVSDHRIVSTILDRFSEEVARRNGGLILPVDGHFYIGTAGMSRWHIDPGKHYRLLGNLTRSTLGLKVATQWTPEDNRTLFLPTPPAQFKITEYNPGGGLLIDNNWPDPERVPHAGIDSPGKVYFRGIAVVPVE